MTIAILAFAVFFLCKCWIHISTVPYAVNEYREAADVQLTEAFLKGEIPYRLESLDAPGEMPPVLYQYSFLNSVVCALFSLLLGRRVVLAHYLVAFLSMIGSSILSFHLIGKRSGQTILPVLGAVLTLFCHWRFGYLSTTPNSLGIFLTLLTFTFAVSEKVKYKSVLVAGMCILLFYTKLYFVTFSIAVFLYFLLYDRLEAIKFLGMCICLGALSVLLIQYFWPLYFTYSVYFINGTNLWNSVSKIFKMTYSQGSAFPSLQLVVLFLPDILFSSLSYVIMFRTAETASQYVFEQFGYMATVFGPLFLILIYSLTLSVLKKRKIKIEENDILILAVIQVIVQGLCMFVLGRGDGAYLSYYLQLWIPYVIIASLILAEKDIHFSREILKIAFIALLSFLLLYFGYKRLPLFMMTEEQEENWKQAKSYTDMCERGEVYYSPVLAYLAMDKGEQAYNNGHTGIMGERASSRWEEDQLAHKVFPDAGKIINQNLEYQERIKEKIREHSYALVTTDDEQLFVDDVFLSENGYKQIDELPLAVGNADYNVRFWVPKEE